MMTNIALLAAAGFLLLSACGGGEDGGNDATGNRATAAAAAAPIAPGANLTGLYEKKEGGLSSQLCVIERTGSAARFGLNIWGANMHSCSGAGTITRDGDRLQLVVAGDRSCTLEARIEGSTIRLPDTVPAGCAYYCGARAQMAGVSLARTGASEADALKARDVVDEPLCDAGRRG